MKKVRQLCLIGCSAMLLVSCSFYTIHGVTNNPVGKKTGTVSMTPFKRNGDFSYSAAAKAGKINQIGSWEIKTGFLKISTTVSGEQAAGVDKSKDKGKAKSKAKGK
jgi:hypothetical protein